jgi:hypothetical protein
MPHGIFSVQELWRSLAAGGSLCTAVMPRPLATGFSSWFVAVPATVSMLLAGLGAILLLLPAIPASSPGSILMIRGTIVLATLGGIILTKYFHGNSDADRTAISTLWQTLERMGLPLLLGGVLFTISILTQKFKSKSKEPNT